MSEELDPKFVKAVKATTGLTREQILALPPNFNKNSKLAGYTTAELNKHQFKPGNNAYREALDLKDSFEKLLAEDITDELRSLPRYKWKKLWKMLMTKALNTGLNKVKPEVQVKAATLLLAYAMGKPTETVKTTSEQTITLGQGLIADDSEALEAQLKQKMAARAKSLEQSDN